MEAFPRDPIGFVLQVKTSHNINVALFLSSIPVSRQHTGGLTDTVATSVKEDAASGYQNCLFLVSSLSSPSLAFFFVVSSLEAQCCPGAMYVSSVPKRDVQISSHRFTLGCHSCLSGDEPEFTKTSFSAPPPLSVVQWLCE